MKKIFTFLFLALVSTQAYSSNKSIYLSCPHFDERAPDLVVVLDQSNGTASLQSPSMGEGLNFTAPASFGPDRVTWRRDEKNWKRSYSVNRSTLEFERKTYSVYFDDTSIAKSDCKIIKSPGSAKF